MRYKAYNKRYERLNYRRCGHSGLKLPPITLGLWHNFGGKSMSTESKKMIFRAFDRGVTNSDLANNYGNFCQRTFSFAEKNCKSVVPIDIDFNTEDLKILNSFSNNINKIRSFMDNQQLNEYVKFIVDKSFDANKYFNDEAPWNKKDDKRRSNTIVYVSLEIIRKISILLLPIIPYSANTALVSLNISTKTLKLSSITDHLINKSGTKIINQGILFKKIEKNND
jgi:methionyl-tRNA synthetase